MVVAVDAAVIGQYWMVPVAAVDSDDLVAVPVEDATKKQISTLLTKSIPTNTWVSIRCCGGADVTG